MHFNLLDILLLGVFGAAVADGVRRGFLSYAAEFLAFALGVGLALLLFGHLAAVLRSLLGVAPGLASFGSFLIILVGSHALTVRAMQRWTAWVAARLERRLSPDAFRAAGALPALGTAMMISALVLSALVQIPAAGSRSLVLGSTLASALAGSSSFLQPGLHSLLVPPVNDSSAIVGGGPQKDFGDEAYYRLRFPSEIQPQLAVKAEVRMLEMLNRSRVAAGLTPLHSDPTLESVARAHSLDMYRRAYFSHHDPERQSPFDRLKAAGVVYVTAGENIAYSPDVGQAEESLMRSPDHRANILNPDFRCVGIGIYRASGYEEMFTQDFADCL